MAQTKAQLLGPVVGDVVMDVSTLSLDSEGNKVGIGTTEADLTLHVNGVNALPSTSGSTPTGHLTLRNKAGSSSHGMFMGVSNAAPWSSWIQAQDANNNAANYPLLLNPNGGKVGIGTSNSPNNFLHVVGNDYQTLRLENTDDSANGPYIELYNNSSSPADNDYIGIISFKNRNSNNKEITYSQIRSQSVDVTDGAEDGNITFHTRLNGTFGERLRIIENGMLGIGHHSAAQITKELTIRPENDGGIMIGRPGDTVTPINAHLLLTTTSAGQVFPTGEAYTVKYNTRNCDSIFTTFEGGGTGGNISFQTGVGNGNAIERLRIKSDSQLLHTRSDDTTRYDLEFRQTGGITDGNYGGIHWTQGSTGSTNLAAIEIEYADSGRPAIVFKNRQSSGTSMSEAFRITSDGQLQATSAADVRLTLGSSGTAGTNDSVHIRADGANLKFMSASGGSTIFEANGTGTVSIASDGQVQVSNSVSGNDAAVNIYKSTGDNSDKAILRVGYDAAAAFEIYRIRNNGDIFMGPNQSGASVRLNTVPTGGSVTESVTILHDGRIGINDTNPERAVDIRANNCMVQLQGTGGGGRQYSLCSTDNTTGASAGSAGSFVIYDDTSGDARLSITSDGTVHINSADSASGGRIYAATSKLYLQSGNGRQSFNIADMTAGSTATHEFNPSGNLVLAGSVSAKNSVSLTDTDTSARLNVHTDLSGNYTGWKEKGVAAGSMSQASIDSKTPTLNDFTYPNSSNGMLIWSTSKIGFAAGGESPQYGTGVQMLFDSAGLMLGGNRAFDRTSSTSTTTNYTVRLKTNGTGVFTNSLQANSFYLTSSNSWIQSAYGAISNSTVLSLNNLLIGQNMRGHVKSRDGNNNTNNFYHTTTHGGMGYNGTEYCYDGITKFYNGTGATTQDATFTPSVSMQISGNGIVTKPKNPAFSARKNASNWTVAANAIFDFDTDVFDVGNNYNTSNYRFTAPVSGIYQINFYSIYYAQTIGNAAIFMKVNGSRVYGGDIHFSVEFSASRWHNVSYSHTIQLSANDYVEIYNGSISVNYHGNHWSRFAGHLVG